MKLNLKIQYKILLLIALYLFIPFIIVLWFITHNSNILLKEKFNKEIKEKKEYIQNFVKFQNLNLKKILKQLSFSKEIINISNNLAIYENNELASNNLKALIKNLDFNEAILYNSTKKVLITTNQSYYSVPEKFLSNKINIFYIQNGKEFYLIGTSPLFVGTYEKNIYGYIALIKKIDKNYLKSISSLFNICCLKISNEILEDSNLNIEIGETITGKPLILNGYIDNSFYEKVKKQNNIILISITLALIIFCIIISYFISNDILKPINYLKNVIDSIISEKLSIKIIKYSKKDEISEIIQKLNILFNKFKNLFNIIWKNLNEEKNNLKSLKEDIEFFNSNKYSLLKQNSKIKEKCYNVNSQIKILSNITDSILKDYNISINTFNNINELSSEVVDTSNISNITFKEINRNSEEIKNFLTSIIDISSQINLLSVNASIEAIKSGEVGSGFSVVADEIKNLAETTKDFVENIQKLIENNYQIVKQGVEYSEKINNLINQLNEQIKEIHLFLTKLHNEINNQKRMISELEANMSEPYEIYNFIEKNILNNLENIINEFSKKINNILKLNEDSIEKIQNFITPEEDNENKKKKD